MGAGYREIPGPFLFLPSPCGRRDGDEGQLSPLPLGEGQGEGAVIPVAPMGSRRGPRARDGAVAVYTGIQGERLSGAMKANLRVADPRQVTFFCSGQKKVTQEKAAPDGALSLRFAPLPSSSPTVHPVPGTRRGLLTAPLRAGGQRLAMLGGAIRG